MIKIVVAVAGLALVEAPVDGPITLHFPATKGFLVPAPSLYDPLQPRPLEIDEHRIDVYFGDSSAQGLSAFKFQIVGAGGVEDRSALEHFMDFGKVLEGTLHDVRGDCRYSYAASLADCRAKGTDTKDRELLAGQIQLNGNWAVAAGMAKDPRERTAVPLDKYGASRVRLLVDREARSRDYSRYPKNYKKGRNRISLADLFLFETTVEAVDGIASGNLDGLAGFLTNPPRGKLAELCGATPREDCRVLWIENQAPCRLAGGCHATSAFFGRLDIHLAHLYRLLKTYEVSSGQFVDPLFVPFGEVHAHSLKSRMDAGEYHPKAGGSPRCYGGVVIP